MTWIDWFLIGVFLLIAAVIYIFAGGRFLLKHDGKWCVATLAPQICLLVGPDNKALSTGWNKMKNHNIWYRDLFNDSKKL